jgi:hypothetical protein
MKRFVEGTDRGQTGEVITHLAFYVGWPNAFSAMPVAKDVFVKRARANPISSPNATPSIKSRDTSPNIHPAPVPHRATPSKGATV